MSSSQSPFSSWTPSHPAPSAPIEIPKPRKPMFMFNPYIINFCKYSQILTANLENSLTQATNSESKEEINTNGNPDSRISESENVSGSLPYSYPPVKLSKEERKKRIEKYLEKKKKRKYNKKVIYECRKSLADKRMRFQGRFVKTGEAKKLIRSGESVTARDHSDLNKLINESLNFDKHLVTQYNRSKLVNRGRIFKTTKDLTLRKNQSKLSLQTRSSQNSGSTHSERMMSEDFDQMQANMGSEGEDDGDFSMGTTITADYTIFPIKEESQIPQMAPQLGGSHFHL